MENNDFMNALKEDKDFMDFMNEMRESIGSKTMDEMKEVTVSVSDKQMYDSCAVLKLMRVSLMNKPLEQFAFVQLNKNEWSDENIEIMTKHLNLVRLITDIINKIDTEQLRNEGA